MANAVGHKSFKYAKNLHNNSGQSDQESLKMMIIDKQTEMEVKAEVELEMKAKDTMAICMNMYICLYCLASIPSLAGINQEIEENFCLAKNELVNEVIVRAIVIIIGTV